LFVDGVAKLGIVCDAQETSLAALIDLLLDIYKRLRQQSAIGVDYSQLATGQ
jgi:hypothetical protein